MLRSCLVLGVLLAAIGGAQAQSPAPGLNSDKDVNRFSYHRHEDGFVRLDLRTGQVSHCAKRASGWACVGTADDRTAFEAEIARLQAENTALKKTLLDRGIALPDGTRPDAPATGAPGSESSKAESDAEVVMNFVQRIWERLVEMMANIQRDLEKT